MKRLGYDRYKLPTFIVIGAMKAGTSSLAHYLAHHPQVFMTSPKEPSFFDPDHNWGRGLEWYAKLFERAGSARALGEASTTYTRAPHVKGVPRRIATTLPGVKLIYLVRHPVVRIQSMYVYHLDRGLESLSIDQAVRQNPVYLDVSRYASQLREYLDWFPLDQIFIVSSERLLDQREETMREVLQFIGVDPHMETETLRQELKSRGERRRTAPAFSAIDPIRVALRTRGVTGKLPRWLLRGLITARRVVSTTVEPSVYRMSRETEEWLWDRLEPEVERLSGFVGPDFPLWHRSS